MMETNDKFMPLYPALPIGCSMLDMALHIINHMSRIVHPQASHVMHCQAQQDINVDASRERKAAASLSLSLAASQFSSMLGT